MLSRDGLVLEAPRYSKLHHGPWVFNLPWTSQRVRKSMPPHRLQSSALAMIHLRRSIARLSPGLLYTCPKCSDERINRGVQDAVSSWIACLYQLVLWVQGFVVSIPTILSGSLARTVSLGPCWATSLRMARMHAWSLAPHHPHRIHTGKRFWTLIISKIAETCRNGKCKS